MEDSKMSKYNLCGLMLLAALTLAVGASEAVAVAVVIQTSENDNMTEDVAPTAWITHDGVEYPAVEGTTVYAGDEVKVSKDGSIGVGFLDQTAVTLAESAVMTVGGTSAIGVSEGATFNLASGRALVATKSTESTPLNMSFGDAHAPVARAAGPKPAKFELLLTSTAGVLTTNVELP